MVFGNSIVGINTVSEVFIGEGNIHNLYFQMLLDCGLIGVLAYIWIILKFVFKEWKNFFNNPIIAFKISYFILGFIQFRGGDALMFYIVGIYLLNREQKKGILKNEEKN